MKFSLLPGFSQRILLIALGGFLLSTLIISMEILRIFETESRQTLLAQQREMSEMVARRLEGALRERQKMLESFTRQLHTGGELLPHAEIQQTLDSRVGLHRFFNGGMVVLDSNARSIVDSPVVPGRSGIDFSDRDYIQQVREQKRTVTTRPLIGRGLQSPVFVVCAPILGAEGELLGFLFGVTRLADANLFQEVAYEALGGRAELWVIDPALGLFVTASDPTRALQPLAQQDRVITQVLAGVNSGYVMDASGEVKLFSAVALPSMGWQVIHLLPESLLLVQHERMLKQITLLIVVFTVLMVLLIWLLLRQQLRSLRVTAGQIGEMVEGKRPYQPLLVQQLDEVGQLIAAFNRLQQQLAEHILELEQRNREMLRLSEVMAHHFQEPARRLVSFAQRLQGRSALAEDEDARMALAFIDQQARRLSLLVRDAQRYLSLNQQRSSEVSGSAECALEQALGDLGEARHGVVITVTTPLPRVRMADSSLRELFAILLDNALRYRSEERPLQIEISATLGAGRALFRVADNGSGIAVEYREQALGLFIRLVPNSIPGTGMGLALVEKMVGLGGGQVRIEDGLSGGVAVCFDLPLAQERGATENAMAMP